MTSPGLELLLRVVADQLREKRCESCESPLGGSRMTLRERSTDQVVVDVTCPGCDRILLLQIKPDPDGVARVG